MSKGYPSKAAAAFTMQKSDKGNLSARLWKTLSKILLSSSSANDANHPALLAPLASMLCLFVSFLYHCHCHCQPLPLVLSLLLPAVLISPAPWSPPLAGAIGLCCSFVSAPGLYEFTAHGPDMAERWYWVGIFSSQSRISWVSEPSEIYMETNIQTHNKGR